MAVIMHGMLYILIKIVITMEEEASAMEAMEATAIIMAIGVTTTGEEILTPIIGEETIIIHGIITN